MFTMFTAVGEFRFIGIRQPGVFSTCNRQQRTAAEEIIHLIENQSIEQRNAGKLHGCHNGLRLDYQRHYAGQGKHRGKHFADLAVQTRDLVLASAHIQIGVDFGADNIQEALLLSLKSENGLAVRLVRK